MTTDELIKALTRMKSETGSLADSLCCLGCGHEHNCGVHGCAVIREAIKTAKLYQAAYKALDWVQFVPQHKKRKSSFYLIFT